MTDGLMKFGDDGPEAYIPTDPAIQERSEAMWREFVDALEGGRMFIRVRSARPGAALHEFDVPIVEVEQHPDRYKVINKKPVAKQRPASHISGVVKTSKPKRAPKTGEDSTAMSEPADKVDEEK